MGIFFTGLAWFFGTFIGTIILRAVFALGFGYVTYTGLQGVVGPWMEQISFNTAALGGFGPHAAYAMASLRVIPSISLILGAVQLHMTIRIMTAVGRRAVG